MDGTTRRTSWRDRLAPEEPTWYERKRANGNGSSATIATTPESPASGSVAPPALAPGLRHASMTITPTSVPPHRYTRPEGWSAPYSSSPYTEPPHPMESARMIIVEFQPDPAALLEVIPEPLEPGPNPWAVAAIGDNRQMPTSMRFQEGMVVVNVRFGDQTGSFVPYIWTSTDEAMLAAREISGRPKLLCDHNVVQEMGSQASAVITRRGETLMRASITLTGKGNPTDLPFKGGWYSVRKIQMPEPGRPALKQVIHHDLSGSFRVTMLWEGRGYVEFPGQSFSAVHRLKPLRIGRAWYVDISWDLTWGKNRLGSLGPADRTLTVLALMVRCGAAGGRGSARLEHAWCPLRLAPGGVDSSPYLIAGGGRHEP